MLNFLRSGMLTALQKPQYYQEDGSYQYQDYEKYIGVTPV